MKIKKFNESITDDNVYVVIITEVGGNISDSYSKCFDKEILAADYLIKWTNSYWEEKFEPFFEEDGTRLFISVDENPDYQKCLKLLNQKIEDGFHCDDIQIVKLPIERKFVNYED